MDIFSYKNKLNECGWDIDSYERLYIIIGKQSRNFGNICEKMKKLMIIFDLEDFVNYIDTKNRNVLDYFYEFKQGYLLNEMSRCCCFKRINELYFISNNYFLTQFNYPVYFQIGNTCIEKIFGKYNIKPVLTFLNKRNKIRKLNDGKTTCNKCGIEMIEWYGNNLTQSRNIYDASFDCCKNCVKKIFIDPIELNYLYTSGLQNEFEEYNEKILSYYTKWYTHCAKCNEWFARAPKDPNLTAEALCDSCISLGYHKCLDCNEILLNSWQTRCKRDYSQWLNKDKPITNCNKCGYTTGSTWKTKCTYCFREDALSQRGGATAQIVDSDLNI